MEYIISRTEKITSYYVCKNNNVIKLFTIIIIIILTLPIIIRLITTGLLF